MTNLSEILSRDTLIDLLNCYFGAMCDAVASSCSEILKFTGDAMLAIFTVIAPAVNLMARIEKMCRQLRRQL